MSVDFELKGVAAFTEALGHIVERMETAAGAGITTAHGIVTERVKAQFGAGKGPTSRSGKLADSITLEGPKKGMNGYEGRIGPAGLAYVRIVELGKKGRHSRAPHPYFAPGFKEAQAKFAEVFRKAWS